MRPSKLSLLALSFTAAFAYGEPLTQPVGELLINSNLVRTGQRPTLNWKIAYPNPLDELIEVEDPGTITVKTRTEVEIRVVGVAFQDAEQLLPASLQAQFNGGSWLNLFTGNEQAVRPSEILYKGLAEAGTTLNFSARGGERSGGWSFSADTLTSNPQVTPLREGDYVPTFVPAYDQGNIESYLSQYISSDNKVTIGPRDLIYLFELGATDPSSRYFDMQDIAMVITFKDLSDSQ